MNSKHPILASFLFCFLIIWMINGCVKDYVAKTPPPEKSFTEDFDTVANLYNEGWVFINNSNPLGAASWQQGIYENGKFGPEGFPAYSYKASADEYIFAGYQSGNDLATISSWMITPPIEMKNGDYLYFYTRTYPGSRFADRLQVRLNVSDEEWDVGRDASSTGKFTILLGDINPNYSIGINGYPQIWTKFQFTVSGLLTPVKRRIAFRYFVENGGPNGTNSNAIGIDHFHFESVE